MKHPRPEAHNLVLISMRLGGSTIRAIASATGISKSQVHRMLKGVEPLRGPRAKRPTITRLHFELVPGPGGGLVAVLRPTPGPLHDTHHKGAKDLILPIVSSRESN